LVQSLTDEFELPAREYTIPSPAGEVLSPDDPGDESLNPGEQSKYRSGVGKLLHLAKWPRPDILNSVRLGAFKVRDDSQAEPLESNAAMHEVHCAHT
jgi:hypothetical protein